MSDSMDEYDRGAIRDLIEASERQSGNIDRLVDVVAHQGANFSVLENSLMAQQGTIDTLASSVHELAETVRRFYEGRANGDT
jgi:hypothetical protein